MNEQEISSKWKGLLKKHQELCTCIDWSVMEWERSRNATALCILAMQIGRLLAYYDDILEFAPVLEQKIPEDFSAKQMKYLSTWLDLKASTFKCN